MTARRRTRTGGAPGIVLVLAGLGLATAACASAGSSAPATLPALVSTPATAATTVLPPAPAPSTTSPATTTSAVPASGGAASTRYVVPVDAGVHIGYARTHHDYPASDVFASPGCGTTIVSPVDGRVLQVRRVDTWTRREDDPATRGGLTVAILGDDGVRYYLAHLQAIDSGIAPHVEVTAGQRIGELGESGDASACHLHFGISPPCPGPEWAVRRGVIWPWAYLDAWRRGEQRSPALEIYAWSTEHPDACARAEADPDAAAGG